MRRCPTCNVSYDEEMLHCPADGTALLSPEQLGEHAGVTLDGRYYLEQRIGAGGLGEVYRARHLRMGKTFAVKLLHRRLLADPQFLGRFDREARAMSRLRHPCCVAVTDYGQSEELGPFIVMELLGGVPLSRYTKGEGLPLGRALALVGDVLSGLEHAHGEGIIHRDLKPDNIICVPQQHRPGEVLPKILDFGVAKIVRAASRQPASEASAELTAAGLVIGTPAYMAPEQLGTAGDAEIDARADLYSVGVVLFELCCGHRPVAGGGALAMLQAHVNGEMPSVGEVRPSLPPELVAIIDRSLRQAPQERFASATELRAALAALLPLPAALAESRPSFEEAAAEAGPPPAPPIEPVATAPTALAPATSEEAHAAPGERAPKITAPTEALPLGGGVAHAPSLDAERRVVVRPRRTWVFVGLLVGLVAIAAVVVLIVASRGDERRPAGAGGQPSRGPLAAQREQPVGSDAAARIDGEGEAAGQRDGGGGWQAPAALRRAARLWRNSRTRRRGARELMAYLGRHRGDAHAHLFVARQYLQAFWGADGVKLVHRALKADPELRLDPATLVSLCFAYQRRAHWRARRLVDRHGGDRAVRALLVGAAAIRDQGIQRNLLAHALRLGGAKDTLDKRLLALASAHRCRPRRARLAVLEDARADPFVRILLRLLRDDPCLGPRARQLSVR